MAEVSEEAIYNNENMNEIMENEDTNSSAFVNDMPAQMFQHLDFIVSNKGGHILLGSSHLNGRYWGGQAWYYKNPKFAPSIEKCDAAEEFLSGVVDCDFLAEDKALIGQDGGLILFVSINEVDQDHLRLEKVAEIETHLLSVTSVSVGPRSETAFTSSIDGSIRLWDCQTTACKKIFQPAHTQAVTGVSPHLSHSDLFLSSSLDGNVLLWDMRINKPASCLFRDTDNCPTAVSWVSDDGGGCVVGTLAGSLMLISTKNVGATLCDLPVLDRPIYRLCRNNHSPSPMMSVCGDTSSLVVCNISKDSIDIRYENDRHTDFVRGMTWLGKSQLISCGWDKNVFHHSLS